MKIRKLGIPNILFIIVIFDVDSDHHQVSAILFNRKSKHFYLRKLPKKRNILRKFHEIKLRIIDTVTRRRVYYWYSATDCDHTHVEYE